MRGIMICIGCLLAATGCVMRGNVNYYSMSATTEGRVSVAARDNGGAVNADKDYNAAVGASHGGNASADATDGEKPETKEETKRGESPQSWPPPFLRPFPASPILMGGRGPEPQVPPGVWRKSPFFDN